MPIAESKTTMDARHAAMDAVGEWYLSSEVRAAIDRHNMPRPATKATPPRYHHLMDAGELLVMRNLEAMDAPHTLPIHRTVMLEGLGEAELEASASQSADLVGLFTSTLQGYLDNLGDKPTGADATQVDGDHYKGMGDHQPWNVLQTWLTPEEYRGYQKGVVIAYLAREKDKGGNKDIAKAKHHLEKLLETLGE